MLKSLFGIESNWNIMKIGDVRFGSYQSYYDVMDGPTVLESKIASYTIIDMFHMWSHMCVICSFEWIILITDHNYESSETERKTKSPLSLRNRNIRIDSIELRICIETTHSTTKQVTNLFIYWSNRRSRLTSNRPIIINMQSVI